MPGAPSAPGLPGPVVDGVWHEVAEVVGDQAVALAYAQARRLGLSTITLHARQAAVPFYGVGPAVPKAYAGLTAAVQGHYGERDDFPCLDAQRTFPRRRGRAGKRCFCRGGGGLPDGGCGG